MKYNEESHDPIMYYDDSYQTMISLHIILLENLIDFNMTMTMTYMIMTLYANCLGNYLIKGLEIEENN